MVREHAKSDMPNWVKGFVAAGVVLALIVIVMIAMGHGPGQHVAMH